MRVAPKSSHPATLPRAQQLLILVLGLGFTGLWAWRAGLLWPPAPSVSAPLPKIFIAIQGDLPRPGLYVFSAPPTTQEVWEAAGGQGTVRGPGQPLPSGSRLVLGPEGECSLERLSGSELLTLGLALDPNLATAADLAALPGIGPVLAQRIVAFREEHGPFKNIADLQEVKGLGPATLANIRSFIEITPMEPDPEPGEK